MSTKSRSRNRGCGAAIAFCAAMVPVVADAQDAAIDRIETIERKIRGLAVRFLASSETRLGPGQNSRCVNHEARRNALERSA